MTGITAPLTLEQLQSLACIAGMEMLEHHNVSGVAFESKSDTTPVTKADLAIHHLVHEFIRSITDEVVVVSEEGDELPSGPWCLFVDPIDGTLPYTWGLQVSCFMAGLTFNGIPVMGVIHNPWQSLTLSAEIGGGTWANNVRVHALDGLLGQGKRPIVGIPSWPGAPHKIDEVRLRLAQSGIGVIDTGCIGAMQTLVAMGHLAATVFVGSEPHDTMPGHPIVQEAGGRVTDLRGNPLTYGDGPFSGHVMSNGGPVHDLILDTLGRLNGW